MYNGKKKNTKCFCHTNNNVRKQNKNISKVGTLFLLFLLWEAYFTFIDLPVLAESPPERTGRRRSMPGNSSDKTTPTMEATSTTATPFRVTVSTVSWPLCIVSVLFASLSGFYLCHRLGLLCGVLWFSVFWCPDGLMPT